MNLLLITRRQIEASMLEQIERNHNVKVLYHFGAEFDVSPLNDLSWADKIIVEDALIDEIRPALKVDIHPLSQYITFSKQDQLVPKKRTVSLAKAGHARPQGNVLFVPCNDTHVRMFLPIAQRIDDHNFLVIRGENADAYLDRYSEPYRRIGLELFGSDRYRPVIREEIERHGTSVIVFANDWVGENVKICQLARELGIPTVCIQEGPHDFELDGGKWRQMQNADYVFAQGFITLRYLEAKHFIITGNPRLSFYRPAPLPVGPMVMINSNFTYNIYEDWRDRWVGDCVSVCNQLQIPYFISQHPRDNGVFENYNVIKSDAFKIIDQIKNTSVLITRFSQVLYEAMLMGRQVIYYNPHGEVKRVLTDNHSGAFFVANSPESLEECLREAIKREFTNQRERDSFLKLHCGPCDGREVERCLISLAHIANGLAQQSTRDIHAEGKSPIKKLRSIMEKRTERRRLTKELKSIIQTYGPYTAHNMKLADGVFTIDDQVNYDHFKLNRIKQLVADLGFLREGVRLMDIASLQSMFAIEFAIEGLEVTSIEGRKSNLEKGRFAAQALGINNIRFYLDDVNNITPKQYGEYDVILCMGILYHIAKERYLDFLRNVAACCKHILIVDSFVSLHGGDYVEQDGVRYEGTTWREFDDTATDEEREKSVHSALYSNLSFSMTKESLLRYLEALGFTSVSEVHLPAQPNSPLDRITLVCRKGTPVSLKVFPDFDLKKHFDLFVDTSGMHKQNVVHWNLPRDKENGKGHQS